ncbi:MULTISPECIES: DNA alkylation repair protein [Metabacillus]|uniref:DNA alkylation repair protein n=2 Tax=Metabacillus TaxID=2675233 RepID=A0A179SN47_9BACI|nr:MULTISPECIES: DNA alkylation repair protein [Metabacillus]OAS82758.1 DNA alkylation repair protein [Metabacillus litoralis]QNF30199.1 DNA alkylation repair protein [Metabacillus sp. KUDC1714]
MTYEEIMQKLEELGSEQTKQIYLNHGVKEPYFGVKIGDLKKLVKYVKKNHELALKLYDSGNHDAMYLAGFSINPKLISKETLQDWAKKAYWYMAAEYTVAQVTAESDYALELAREWMKSEDEMVAVCGWSTYSNYLSITPDEKLDIAEIKTLLNQVKNTVHEERNRVRYVMNGFVLSVGAYVTELCEEAKQVAEFIGKVHVDVGNTACKVPLASEYIKKIEMKNRVGMKRKTCIC